jgi:hypothetical protein
MDAVAAINHGMIAGLPEEGKKVSKRELGAESA